MDREEKIQEIRQTGQEEFFSGIQLLRVRNGSSSVAGGHRTAPEVKKLATGFGGGTGFFGDSCGAVAGAGVRGMSAVHGRSAYSAGEGKEALMKSKEQLYGKPGLYRLFNQIPITSRRNIVKPCAGN